MLAVATRPGTGGAWKLEWLPVVVGLCVLYVPTLYDLSLGFWSDEDNAHGPVILAAAAWMLWQQRAAVFGSDPAPGRSASVAGSLLLALGLLCYAVGRSQALMVLEAGSLVPLLAASVLLLKGWRALRAAWFPLSFLLFFVPLPGIIVNPLTGALREHVSALSEAIVFAAGYPIARSGVILTIGQYQLLVADACSGINSLFSLSALGLLYLHLTRHAGWARNAVLVLAILPIAFAANIVRVVILVLVTYHFGDAAGQGIVHGLSGMVLFIIALLLLLGLDAALGAVFNARKAAA